VFKCTEKRLEHRIYGFLCNPKFDRSYQVCILVIHAYKKEHGTHETYLKQVEEMRTTLAIQRAIAAYFKEKP
jgi:hypothetical protein